MCLLADADFSLRGLNSTTKMKSKFYFSFRLVSFALDGNNSNMVKNHHISFHSVYLTQMILVNTQLFPPCFFWDSDDSIRIIMILISIHDSSMRNSQIDTNSPEMCQFFLSSFDQLQRIYSKNFFRKSPILIAYT